MSRLSGLKLRSRAPINIDVKNPRSVAVCDGCGMWTMHDHLVEKREYRGGTTPVGTGLWVCGVCDDVPNPYFSKMVLAPDPVPIKNPRPEQALVGYSGYGYLVTENGDALVSNDDVWDWGWITTIEQRDSY